MNEFLFWCRHPLVHLLFYEVTLLHPPSFREMIFPLVDYSNGWCRAVHQHESEEHEESMCLISGAVLFILHSKQRDQCIYENIP